MAARGKNAVYAAGLLGVVSIFGLLPAYFLNRTATNQGNLQTKEGALSGSQIMRGNFLNSGSNDIGADPDWDVQNRVYTGKTSWTNRAGSEALAAQAMKRKRWEDKQAALKQQLEALGDVPGDDGDGDEDDGGDAAGADAPEQDR